MKIYAVQCENNSEANNFYQTIASQTFGHHVSLNDIRQIEKVLMDICYREKMLLKVHVPALIVHLYDLTKVNRQLS